MKIKIKKKYSYKCFSDEELDARLAARQNSEDWEDFVKSMNNLAKM